MSFPNILLAIFIFGFLIFIHELGHFLAARAFGVTVLEFSIGMGPKLLSRRSKKTGTLYSIRLFPIGGYVNMLGEGANANPVPKESKKEDDKASPDLLIQDLSEEEAAREPSEEESIHSYAKQKVWKRILISLAGPAMNLLLGFLLMLLLVILSGTSSLGGTKVAGFFTQYAAKDSEYGLLEGDYLEEIDGVRIQSYAQLEEAVEAAGGSLICDLTVERINAEKTDYELITLTGVRLTKEFLVASFTHSLSEGAGLKTGDVVKKVNSTRVHTYNELSYEILYQGYRPLTLTVERAGETIVLENVVFRSITDDTGKIKLGEMDFRVYREENPGLWTILKHSFYRSLSAVKMVWDSIGGLLSGRFGFESISGPVGITKTISDTAKTGALNLLYLIIVISINLGIMNLLPLPALDGGHIFFHLLEGVRGKPIKPEVEAIVNFVGLFLLLALAVVVAVKDVISL